MSSKIKKIIALVIVIVMFILPLRIVRADEELVSLDATYDGELIPGGTITLTVTLKNVKRDVDAIIAELDYDKTVFEEVVEDDMIPVGQWQYPVYNPANGMFSIDRNGQTAVDEEIMKVELKVKDDIIVTGTEVRLSGVEVAGLGIDSKTEKETKIPIGKQEDGLYLKSSKYKIGNGDINNYEEGDKYIARIKGGTTLAEFINNCETNGTIVVTKEDAAELTNEEFIGTGMTLTVTKDSEKIEVKTVVIGDIDGDGKVTITDVVGINQGMLKMVTLENEYQMAADLDEDGQITITDVVGANQILLSISE